MAITNDNDLPKEPFTPTDKEVTLFLSTIFRKYYHFIKLINSRYRSYSGLRPQSLTYLCLLHSFPNGLTIEEIKEIMGKKGTPHEALSRIMDLGYIERSKGKIRGSYNLTPDTYYLTLSGKAVVESILNSIKR